MSFGIAKNVRSEVQECTPELLNRVLDSVHVSRICAEIEDALEKCRNGELTKEEYETIKSELKKKLPIFTFHAMFKHGRRKNNDAIASGLAIYDLDHIPNPQAKWEAIKNRAWELGIVMAHISPSLEGLRLVFIIPPGMSLAEAQAWMARKLGDDKYDACVKDFARCSFAVPREYVLFLDEEGLFAPQSTQSSTEFSLSSCHPVNHLSFRAEQSEAKNLEGTKVDVHVNAPEILRRSAPLNDNAEKSAQNDNKNENKEKNSVELRVLCGEKNYPQTHENIPYSDIIEVLEEQMGGRPDIGSRNNFIFSMACHLRYICDDNPAWIAQVLPTYGEEWPKFEATVRSACNRIQTKAMPRIIKRTLSICRHNSDIRHHTSDINTPPELPDVLPPLIQLLVSRTPKIYQPAVANAVFPALGAHLWQTTFRYIDNCPHEATLATLLLAPTGSGKSCVNVPIDYIMADIRERDKLNMEKERRWKEDMQTKGANKDKKKRPQGIIIQEIDPDSTSAAFVQRMADAEGRFLYARMNEIQQLNNLASRGNSHNVFDLLCLAFDYGNIHGQTRVGTGSVSERVCVRFNYNVSTTIRKGQQFFRNVLTDGPLSRINMCTIPEREIGAEMPVYGTYGEDFAEELKPYIDHLNAARGLIECKEASQLARVLMQENADFARLSQSRVYENFSFRANVIAFLKAMVLYVANGEVWDDTMEDFIRWSLRYDLWCKMHFFGQAIEEQEYGGEKGNHRGPQNLLDLLPEVFTREEAGMLRQRQGIRTGSLSFMLGNWKKRGYIELYGEEMPQKDIHRQRYIKSESYLREHPQKGWSVGQLVS